MIKKLLARSFDVGETSKPMDLAILILRLMVMSCLLYHHGSDKIPDWDRLVHRPVPLDPIGIGVIPSLVFATFADLLCATLVMIGLATRIASVFCGMTVFAVCFMIYNALGTPFWPVPHVGHAEVAWVYLAVCIFLFIVGPGRYSVDAMISRKK